MTNYLLLCLLISALLSCTPVLTPIPLTQAARTYRAISTCNISSVITADDFEEPQFPFYFLNQATNKSDISFSPEQSRAGNTSLKFHLTSQPNKLSPPGNYASRAELSTFSSNIDTTEAWYGFSMFVPAATMKNDAYPVLLMQWPSSYFGYKGGYSYGTPPILLILQPNSKLQLIYSYSPTTPVAPNQAAIGPSVTRNLGKITFDQWVDYVVHVRFSPAALTGILQLWQDGTPVVNEQRIRLGYRAGKPLWKFGINCYTGSASHTEKTVYFDQIRIGTQTACYDAVAPASTNGVFKPLQQ
ncbi:heparin lyase I family protein [Spirosoma sp. SC4-14]|uniref:heparin lyase I family protein n=1 Tax=Spirosoma sp. SC4-14 TaxID=3128900 RepID=UPI0030CDA7DD